MNEKKFENEIDRIEYDGNLGSDHKYLDAPTPLFGTAWKKIELIAPSKNSSIKTQRELEEIIKLRTMLYPRYDKTIRHHDINDLESLFIKLFESNHRRCKKKQVEFLKAVSGELTSIGLHFKMLFKRARPRQLLKRLYDIEIVDGATTKSPSYPSTHAIIGRFFSAFLSEHYPSLRAELYGLGDAIGKGRVIAGYHFPSDYYSGVYIADSLFKILKKM
jgi:hypothetical protein